jgi:hypothetical protein
VASIPARLRDRLAPPGIFHEILEHRWYLSEQAGRDVGTTAAARFYFDTVLPHAPRPLTTVCRDTGGTAFSLALGRRHRPLGMKFGLSGTDGGVCSTGTAALAPSLLMVRAAL